MPFWLALVYEGARVGGQHEETNICHQYTMLSLPTNFPDTTAGANYNAELTKQAEEKHTR